MQAGKKMGSSCGPRCGLGSITIASSVFHTLHLTASAREW